jgi:gliding motility-associated protein GldM
MNLRYWEDDTAQINLPVSQRDQALMKEFKGKASTMINFSGGPGDHVITGEISVKEKGVEKWKPWKFNYSVGSPSAAVSAADLQVLYKGWSNRIKIAAGGFSSEKVSVSCSGCSISSKPDKDGIYIAKVTKGKKATITVSALDDNGKKVELGKEEFRIFSLPPPTAYFGGKAGGKMSKLDALQIPVLTANLGESPLDVPYQVVQFSMLGMSNGNPITLTARSRVLTPEMKSLMKRIPPNGSLTFTNIKVKGPAGVQSLESGVVLKLVK